MRRTREQEARFGDPVTVGEVTLTPLVEVRAEVAVSETTVSGRGRVVPLGVLVEGPDGVRALGLDGEELPHEGFVER